MANPLSETFTGSKPDEFRVGFEYAETQKQWSWVVALYIFLAGLGGGSFLLSYVFYSLNMYQPVVKIIALVAPILVVVGTLCLLIDLGNVKNSYRLFISPATLKTSWMARGTWILTIFIIFGLLYSVTFYGAFNWLPWSPGAIAGQVIGGIAAFLAIFVMIYPGLLFGVLRSIPFWNSPILPLLFFISGLDTGIALVVFVMSAFNPGNASAIGFNFLDKIEIIAVGLMLVTLLLYIYVVRFSGKAAQLSVKTLNNPIFTVGVIIIGIAVPAILLIFNLANHDLGTKVSSAVIGALVLIGGYCLRYSVLKAGVIWTEIEKLPER